MTTEARLLEGNLSRIWAMAFCRAMERGSHAFTPLVASITEFGDDGLPTEEPAIKEALDRALAEFTDLSTETVAGTIFPHSFWKPGVSRNVLFKRYKSIIPSLHRHPANRHGVYFERLIQFPGAPADGNQLEFVIDCFQKGVSRKPALQATLFSPILDLPTQAAVFDAGKDLTRQRRRGFPCLQQVAFAPEQGSLSVSGFYASQYLFRRAYGNYLGLCRLGRFMASEMKLRLVRMTCYAGFAHLDSDGPNKGQLKPLYRSLSDLLAAPR